ncbi:MAG: DUF721 domain-containing protein [candidate division Zixibacteria bacterium]|nr:DUF721 domain-containing protein [candidate division Zixibacteria bacterium]
MTGKNGMDVKKTGGFSSIGNILNSELKKSGLDDKIKAHSAVVHWKNIAGEELSRHTVAIRVRDKKLIVKVDSPILRNELTFLKPDLLDRIRKEIPESGVEDIAFR